MAPTHECEDLTWHPSGVTDAILMALRHLRGNASSLMSEGGHPGLSLDLVPDLVPYHRLAAISHGQGQVDTGLGPPRDAQTSPAVQSFSDTGTSTLALMGCAWAASRTMGTLTLSSS